MSSKVMSRADLIEKTKKHLRSVLISEKGGVALDRLEKDYRDLVSFFFSCEISFGYVSLDKRLSSTSPLFCQSAKDPHSPYQMQVGQSLPYQALGFHSTTALLEAIPDVCTLQQRDGTLMVIGLPSSGTAHILSMVNRQGKKQVTFKAFNTP